MHYSSKWNKVHSFQLNFVCWKVTLKLSHFYLPIVMILSTQKAGDLCNEVHSCVLAQGWRRKFTIRTMSSTNDTGYIRGFHEFIHVANNIKNNKLTKDIMWPTEMIQTLIRIDYYEPFFGKYQWQVGCCYKMYPNSNLTFYKMVSYRKTFLPYCCSIQSTVKPQHWI